ncbi:MAG: hypothetical protein M1832_004107 [Thelocarpon impressellum]|nr:MAG: hypothetical protein M1832_004107 [Thelocarpon impressellum]
MDLEGGEVKTSFKVASVIGAVDVAGIQEFLEKRCDAGFLEVDASTGTFDTVADMKPRVIRVDFAPLSKGPFDRTRQLRQNDAFLSSILDLLPTRKYTVMYTTTPSSSVDSSQYPGGSDTSYKHVAASPGEGDNELKRRTFVGARETNNTLIDGPLFERYQFFTPGIFMGLLIAFILLSILYAGLNGIASLKVSYAAFDKDMGPAAQKKAQ